MKKIITSSPEETQTLASKIVASLAKKSEERGTGTIVALQGNLGAGKTVFVKGVAEYLGIKEMVTSPTFVIEKIYTLPEGSLWKQLIHIDAYRLEGGEELSAIGWSSLATDPNNLIMMEWPEQVGLSVPERAIWIEFETVNEHTRKIKIPDGLL
jgi:tRNA threonylcarbamoyladenosine biosynthesis protein TsaE